MYEAEKQNAAKKAVEYLSAHSIVGLGSGSTASIAIRLIGEALDKGQLEGLKGVATSEKTEKLAREVGIELIDINEIRKIDVTIDGTDEFDPYLNLIKGGGGALVREKIVASLSTIFIVIADSRKQVNCLGAFKLPVEVLPFSYQAIFHKLKSMGLRPALRSDEQSELFVTDNKNYLIDLDLQRINNPAKLATELIQIPGVVDHGLFIDYASMVIMGKGNEVYEFK